MKKTLILLALLSLAPSVFAQNPKKLLDVAKEIRKMQSSAAQVAGGTAAATKTTALTYRGIARLEEYVAAPVKITEERDFFGRVTITTDAEYKERAKKSLEERRKREQIYYDKMNILKNYTLDGDFSSFTAEEVNQLASEIAQYKHSETLYTKAFVVDPNEPITVAQFQIIFSSGLTDNRMITKGPIYVYENQLDAVKNCLEENLQILSDKSIILVRYKKNDKFFRKMFTINDKPVFGVSEMVDHPQVEDVLFYDLKSKEPQILFNAKDFVKY